MNNREFYEAIFGLKTPWEVKDVRLDVKKQQVEVEVGYAAGTLWACPESRERLPVHDHVERRWRHLDTCQFETFIVCRVPRLLLPGGKVWTVPVPWAQKGSRFTLFFEKLAITVLKAAANISLAAQWLRLDWSALQRIMKRAVDRGMARRKPETIEYLGLDEKSFRRGQDYISVMVDVDNHRVLEVEPGRRTENGVALLEKLPQEQRARVKAVAIDMSAAYEAAVKQALPDADVVHDRFHVSKLAGEAVDKVRRAEHKRLGAAGDNRLAGTRYLWLWHPGELDERKLDAFEELALSNLQTARAYYHRLQFMEFWSEPDVAGAQRFFAQWYHEAARSGLEPIKKLARTLRDHLGGLLSYFRHHITNAITEAFNSSIQSIKANARGFRSFDHYRTRVLFFLGALDLFPL